MPSRSSPSRTRTGTTVRSEDFKSPAYAVPPRGLGWGGIASSGGLRPLKVTLLDAQEAALLAGVGGVDGFEQAVGLDQPGFEVFVDVEHEHQVVGFEVASDGRVVAAALGK